MKYKLNEETRRKMSLVHLGSHHSEETKRKISLNRRGIPCSEERKLKMKQYSPWNKGMKGWTSSTSFKRGYIPFNKGKSLSKGVRFNVMEDGIIKTRAQKVWCEANKIYRLPPKCIIHHLDFDMDNDNIDNLQLIDRSTHKKFHNLVIKRLNSGELLLCN